MITIALVLIMSAYIFRREHAQIKEIKRNLGRYESKEKLR